MSIKASHFVKRQTAESRFSHFNGTWEELEELATCPTLEGHTLTSGYRDGVVLSQVRPDRFMCSTHVLLPGEKLSGEFSPRHEGEASRKHTSSIGGSKTPAARVDLVLYRKDVLAEDPEHEAIPGAVWEIVSINASLADFPEPMPPDTLMANHFHESGSNDGGTSTGLSDAEFTSRLRESYMYWRNKTMG